MREPNDTGLDRRRIVVGIGAHDWEDAVDWAADQAQRERRDLTLLHVADAAEQLWHDPAGRDRRIGAVQTSTLAELVLDQARTRVHDRAPEVPVHAVLRSGAVREELQATARDARMLVVGAREHRTLWSRIAGTLGSSVAHRPPCPVVVVHPPPPGTVGGVLVGIDDTEHARAALRFAFEQASATHRPLTVAHVALPPTYGEPYDEPEQHLGVAEAVAGLGEEYPDVPVRTSVERGDPSAVLLRLGRPMSLIVLGAHVRRPIVELLLGSVVSPVVEQASCPVAVVPDAGSAR